MQGLSFSPYLCCDGPTDTCQKGPYRGRPSLFPAGGAASAYRRLRPCLHSAKNGRRSTAGYCWVLLSPACFTVFQLFTRPLFYLLQAVSWSCTAAHKAVGALLGAVRAPGRPVPGALLHYPFMRLLFKSAPTIWPVRPQQTERRPLPTAHGASAANSLGPGHGAVESVSPAGLQFLATSFPAPPTSLPPAAP